MRLKKMLKLYGLRFGWEQFDDNTIKTDHTIFSFLKQKRLYKQNKFSNMVYHKQFLHIVNGLHLRVITSPGSFN